MLLALVVILLVLWFLRYGPRSGFGIPDIPLFTINNQTITLWDVLVFLVVAWLIGILPSPFRQIALVLLVLWVLSELGILAIAGLSSLLVIAIIVGIVFFLLQGFF